MRYLVLLLCLVPIEAAAQGAATWPLDPLNFPRLKTYSAYRSSSNNLLVASNDDSKHPQPGETVVLADLTGPGIVTHIWLTIADNEYAWPRLLRLRVYYDGHKTPSVDAPLGDFFGVGLGYERNLNSLMVRDASFGRARNSYWPMPFRKSCKITVTNEGKRRMSNLYYHVDWQKHASLPEDIGYFHAYYRQGTPPPVGQLYTFLDIKGTGQYVGTVFSVLQSEVGWFGEGDDMFYVDGEKTPRMEGTGTEDYFNDAWGLRVTDGPWTGTPVAEGEGVGARLAGYRWHVPDPVPFTKSIKVQIEHAGWTYNPDGSVRSGFEERPDYFSSVAFWYQKGVNEGLPEPPYGEGRLPHGNALQIEVEKSLGDVTTDKGAASVQKEVFWSKDILFFKAEGPRSVMNVPIDVPRDGRYEVIAQIAQAPDYGDYVATLDGKLTNAITSTWAASDVPPPQAQILHNFSQEMYVAPDYMLGWFDLTKGRHKLTFTCVGKDALSTGYNLGIDGVVLAEVGKFDAATLEAEAQTNLPPVAVPPRTPVYRGRPLSYYVQRYEQSAPALRPAILRQIGAFGEDASPAMKVLMSALQDEDPQLQQAACLALAQMGENAAPAALLLSRVLRSGAEETRQASALALRGMGKAGKSAIPELIEALKDPSTPTRFLAAMALGQMGETAAPAVPALIERLRTPDEEFRTRRNVVRALGSIGPAAANALPTLEEVRRQETLQQEVEVAIQQIHGKKPATWH
jgi:HEAT repeat protein